MSQHYFDTTTATGVPVCVTAGWDRPLQGFFMTIGVRTPKPDAAAPADAKAASQDEEGEDDSAEVWLYNNLDDVTLLPGYGGPLEYFQRKAAELGVKVPARLWAEVRRDRDANVGNRYVTYDAAGIVEDSGPIR